MRGCASGLRGAPKISAADAPIDPIINIRSAPASKAWFANQAAVMATKEPIQLHAISDALRTVGAEVERVALRNQHGSRGVDTVHVGVTHEHEATHAGVTLQQVQQCAGGLHVEGVNVRSGVVGAAMMRAV